ncbi:MAG: TerB N-terminal domain-containing protein [Thermoguttaceae bacterium]|nr:TerB N-terminal domain-containing protein [Thermoguttaceae bacterium]
MKLSELVSYAEEKYQVKEVRDWSGFPGLAYLVHPRTGEKIALLSRIVSNADGSVQERCDIQCGEEDFSHLHVPFLSAPFRLKGKNWIGITFGESTDPAIVRRILDRAVHPVVQYGYTVTLDSRSIETGPAGSDTVFTETPLPGGGSDEPPHGIEIPEMIVEMKKLYDHFDDSYVSKSRNFVRQARFMRDYEDDLEWTGEFRYYFPTYQILNIRQLRGYFTWRKHLRKGDYRPIPLSFAYIYIYELLCGIGYDSPEEGVEKMLEFEAKFIDAGYGNAPMRKNLHAWLSDYAIVRGLPAEIARRYADPKKLELDGMLAVLKEPASRSDGEIFDALCYFGEKGLAASTAVIRDPSRGKRLFAGVWRFLSETYSAGEIDIFTFCFGQPVSYNWRPFSNAVYWEEPRTESTEYRLTECRCYTRRAGQWQETRYERRFFRLQNLHAVLHAADRLFRKEFKTGNPLRERTGESWVTPFVLPVIEAEKKALRRAAAPPVELRFGDLDRIRQDALVTQDRLMTDEEREAELSAEPSAPSEKAPGRTPETVTKTPAETEIPPPPTGSGAGRFPAGLDPAYAEILTALLAGKPIEGLIQSHRLIVSVVADAINEAFFDRIGDNILEWNDTGITVVEDYRDELEQIVKGVKP